MTNSFSAGDFTGLAKDYSANRPDYSNSVLQALLGLLDKSPDQIDFAWIAFMLCGEVFTARHIGLPFGSVASVFHWERVASLLLVLARRLLFLPLARFARMQPAGTTTVDDIDVTLGSDPVAASAGHSAHVA